MFNKNYAEKYYIAACAKNINNFLFILKCVHAQSFIIEKKKKILRGSDGHTDKVNYRNKFAVFLL